MASSLSGGIQEKKGCKTVFPNVSSIPLPEGGVKIGLGGGGGGKFGGGVGEEGCELKRRQQGTIKLNEGGGGVEGEF